MRKTQYFLLFSALFSELSLAWTLRPLAQDQVAHDLHELHHLIREYYGPLKMKEKTIQFELDKIIAEGEKEIRNSKSEEESAAVLARTLGRLNDGHVKITFPEYSSSPGQVKLPFFLTPVEGKALVASVEDSAKNLGIEVGDEVLKFDGKTVNELVDIVAKYESLGNARSNQHLMYRLTYRPSYMVELKPQEHEARVEIKKPNGKTYVVSVIWRPQAVHDKKVLFLEPPKAYVQQAEDFNAVAGATVLSMGSANPFFITPKSKEKFRITRVEANRESMDKFKVDFEDKGGIPDVFASLYNFQGKNILLIRQPTYIEPNYKQNMKVYKSILYQYEPVVDVLVVDQTHNPGGESKYVEEFYQLFIQDRSPAVVQFMRADRRWVYMFEKVAKEKDATLESEEARQLLFRARAIETANEKGEFFIANPIPLNQSTEVSPDSEYTWKKPLLILTDELAGSCGDIFPLLMKKAGFKTFGQPTMGLGGSVEKVGDLTHTSAEVNLTRGLFAVYKADGKYEDKDFVENSGVPVDFAYSHTVEDFRAGFLKYVEEFSKTAIAQIPK